MGAAVDALRVFPPRYLSALLGPPGTWFEEHSEHSEFGILDPRQPRRMVEYLLFTTLPGFAKGPQGLLPSALDPLFWRASRILRVPAPEGVSVSFPKESWFFINGVATDEALARLNAEYLALLFHRPITLVHNATNALGIDLLECAVGKGWDIMCEPALRALPEIVAALDDPAKRRVIVVCHSQGTIIMANVLRALIDETARAELAAARGRLQQARPAPPALPTVEGVADPKHLSKLEIYSFATCATVMTHCRSCRRTRKGKPVPWLEHFANEHDLVARLGMLAPRKQQHGIRIDGDAYCRTNAWGHLLNQHYLGPIAAHLEAPEVVPNPFAVRNGQALETVPRLYGYYAGATPRVF